MRSGIRSAFLAIILSFFALPGFAEESISGSSDSTWLKIRSKIRMRYFSETMTPALRGNMSSVPLADGSEYTPASFFNTLWADYEFAPNYRIVYWQRSIAMLTTNTEFNRPSYYLRAPR